MITGIIAVIILVVVLPPAFSNGQTGVAIAAIVIALLVFAFGMAGRSEDKAYLNIVDYWAKGGPKGEKRDNSERRKAMGINSMEEIRKSAKTLGKKCPDCGGKLGFVALVDDNGVEKNLYYCIKCKGKFTEKA